jgi:hypothetical protein
VGLGTAVGVDVGKAFTVHSNRDAMKKMAASVTRSVFHAIRRLVAVGLDPALDSPCMPGEE